MIDIKYCLLFMRVIPVLCVQWEIADVPNDSPKRSKRGKTNHLKAVSSPKMSERHVTSSGPNPSFSSRIGKSYRFDYCLYFHININVFRCIVHRVSAGQC